jgi:hypothetical protein
VIAAGKGSKTICKPLFLKNNKNFLLAYNSCAGGCIVIFTYVLTVYLAGGRDGGNDLTNV